MPALSLFGYWDSYLSAALYSGNTMSATIHVTLETRDRMPKEIQERLQWNKPDDFALEVSTWSFEEMNVPAYPAHRVFLNVARQLRGYAQEPDDLYLLIRERSLGWTKDRRETRYDIQQFD